MNLYLERYRIIHGSVVEDRIAFPRVFQKNLAPSSLGFSETRLEKISWSSTRSHEESSIGYPSRLNPGFNLDFNYFAIHNALWVMTLTWPWMADLRKNGICIQQLGVVDKLRNFHPNRSITFAQQRVCRFVTFLSLNIRLTWPDDVTRLQRSPSVKVLRYFFWPR